MQEETQLKEIMKTVIHVDMDQLPEEAKNFPILSARFDVKPHEMMGLYLKIEEAFQIEISDSAIEQERFQSFSGILKVILEELKQPK